MKNTKMMKYGVEALWVLDGKPTDVKELTRKMRQEKREHHERALKSAVENNDMKSALMHSKASIKLSSAETDDLKRFLQLSGIGFSQSGGEADFKMAVLSKKGKVDGIFSEDSDLLVHGVSKLYRPLSKDSINLLSSSNRILSGIYSRQDAAELRSVYRFCYTNR